jgi:hypothetical protein
MKVVHFLVILSLTGDLQKSKPSTCTQGHFFEH